MALALSSIPRVPDERVLVGNDTADDAGVFQVSDDLALVHTVDLLAPVVDDPHTFGRIAAVNSLSDVYAMGGTPLSALNVIGFPLNDEPETLGEILRGGQDAVIEAGAALIGGHTFQDVEIRYGLAVTGRIDPMGIITNSASRPGDLLVLTKPLGTGIVTQALLERGVVTHSLHQQVIESMLLSNRAAAETMRRHGAHAATDITGFGFIGHCWEMTDSGRIGIDIFADRLPVFPKVMDLIGDGVTNSGFKMNLNAFEGEVDFAEGVPSEFKGLLFGSETSGGLLIALPEAGAEALVADLNASGEGAAVVGMVVEEHKGRLLIR